MEQEIWKDIDGFEGYYQISNHGRIKSFKKSKDGLILSQTNKHGWYFSVVLTNYKVKSKSIKIHQLVARHFIDNPNNYSYINHIDLNKQNNNYTNLEWCTAKENIAHAIKNKPNMLSGMNFYNKFIKPKKIMQLSLAGDFICEYQNAKEASDATGVCSRNILQVASMEEYKKGKIRKQAGGYIWKYK